MGKSQMFVSLKNILKCIHLYGKITNCCICCIILKLNTYMGNSLICVIFTIIWEILIFSFSFDY